MPPKQKKRKILQQELDSIRELINAFQRKCSHCCLILMKSLDFNEIRVLNFENIHHEWGQVIRNKLGINVKVLYLAIHCNLLDVVKYIVQIAPEELDSQEVGITTLELAFESTQNEGGGRISFWKMKFLKKLFEHLLIIVIIIMIFGNHTQIWQELLRMKVIQSML